MKMDPGRNLLLLVQTLLGLLLEKALSPFCADQQREGLQNFSLFAAPHKFVASASKYDGPEASFAESMRQQLVFIPGQANCFFPTPSLPPIFSFTLYFFFIFIFYFLSFSFSKERCNSVLIVLG